MTVSVRGKPILNDVTMDDANQIGMSDVVHRVISNGSDAPGTVMSDCCTQLRDAFTSADLIISKGQGNFETLFLQPHCAKTRLFFLLSVKLDYVIDMLKIWMNKNDRRDDSERLSRQSLVCMCYSDNIDDTLR